MEIQKGYKVKLYPNKSQRELLDRYLNACRYVYNYFLNKKKLAYEERHENLTMKEMSKELTTLRKNTEWMNGLVVRPLQQSLRQLDVAYNRFFRKESLFPRFKNKYSTVSMKKVIDWSVAGNKIKITHGLIVKFRGNMPKAGKTLTVTKNTTGEYFASTSIIEDVETPDLNNGVGIDLGLNDIVVTSEGEKFRNLKVKNIYKLKLKNACVSLSRKKKDSKNREKAKSKVARIYDKITNIRGNNLNHISKKVTSGNYKLIALENLSCKNMMQNHKLSASIADASWGELVRQITYKQEWKGGKVIKIDRFYPSSKTCSDCGFIVSSLPLDIREWTCPKCNQTHDRDVNAAKNILKKAEEQLCAEGGESSGSATRMTRPVKHEQVLT